MNQRTQTSPLADHVEDLVATAQSIRALAKAFPGYNNWLIRHQPQRVFHTIANARMTSTPFAASSFNHAQR